MPEDGIGERLKERRKALDLSVEQLSKLTALYDYCAEAEESKGVSVAALYKYEKGERLPGARELRFLCFALNVSPNILLLGNEWSPDQAADVWIADAVRNLLKEAKSSKKSQEASDWRETEHSMKLSQVRSRT